MRRIGCAVSLGVVIRRRRRVAHKGGAGVVVGRSLGCAGLDRPHRADPRQDGRVWWSRGQEDKGVDICRQLAGRIDCPAAASDNTGAPLARQGRFAMAFVHPLAREPMCALMAGERAGQRPVRRIRAAQTEGLERAGSRPTETAVDRRDDQRPLSTRWRSSPPSDNLIG